MLIAFALTTVLVRLCCSRGLVVGNFMAPALFDGDAIWIDRISGRWIDYRVGEIISLHAPAEPDGRLLKRVLGVPGDVVLIGAMSLRTLAANEYAVDSDDRAQTQQRTVVGPTEIEGRVLLRTLPMSLFQWRPGLSQ